ncbi:MAG: KGK domain-containing protein [Hormoscilla sp.]
MGDKITIKGCSDKGVFSKGDMTLKISQFIEDMQKSFSEHNLGILANNNICIGSDHKKCLTDGIDCEILEPGRKGWQKGKIKLQVNVEVEFTPSQPETTEPESPLDDLRQKL